MVAAKAGGGGHTVCSQWMAMPDGGSALSLFCVFFPVFILLPVSVSYFVSSSFFFFFLMMAQGGVVAMAMRSNINGGVVTQWL